MKDFIHENSAEFDENYDTGIIQENIIAHLESLKNEFARYFPEYAVGEIDPIKKMARNPFNIDAISLPDDVQEELIELQNDGTCKDYFRDETLEAFWCRRALSYPTLRDTALKFLTPFSTTYLCEQGFATVLEIKNKKRSKLMNPGCDLRVAVAKSICPRIETLAKNMQAQPSH